MGAELFGFPLIASPVIAIAMAAKKEPPHAIAARRDIKGFLGSWVVIS